MSIYRNGEKAESLDFFIEELRKYNARLRETGITPAVFTETLGCQQNEADSEKLRGYAVLCGYELADKPDDATLILVNTCAIREHAEKRALSIAGGFRRIKEEKPYVMIGLCGCMAAEPHRIETIKKSYPYIDFSLDPASIDKLPEVIVTRMDAEKRQFCTGGEKPPIAEGIPVIRSEKHKAYVSIMYGCNNFCSYCIVPYVRGRERSRASSDIITEVKDLVSSGCRDITLLGQNVNSYDGDCDFPTLLSRLDAIDGEFILRFMTSHPKDASDKLIDVMAKSRHIEPHFHLPVQSGSDKVLKEMNRHYDRARYMSIVNRLKEKIPDIVLTTDIIVGFPGETDSDFEDTLSLVNEVRFDMVYTFIYSPRTGTPAAIREDQVPKDVQGARMQRLLTLLDGITAEKNAVYADKTLRVLVDGYSKENSEVLSGRTDGGKLVHFRGEASDMGEFRNVHIDRAESYVLYGTVVR